VESKHRQSNGELTEKQKRYLRAQRQMKLWHEDGRSWTQVAEMLPFDTTSAWAKRFGVGQYPVERVSEERIDAILNHTDYLEARHAIADEIAIKAIQCLEAYREGTLTDEKAENAIKYFRKKADQLCNDS